MLDKEQLLLYLFNDFFKDIEFPVASFCPLCRAKDVVTHSIEQKEEAHLIHINCQRCYRNVIAIVFSGGFGTSSVGLITDLDSRDVVRFQKCGALSFDDVLAAHQELERYGLIQECIDS